jgi:uncharacterized Tic20 family protein
MMSDFDNVTAPPPAPTGEVASEDRTLALIVHLSGIVAGFVVPLIIWLINKDKPEKAFVIDQSKEALNFNITLAIAYVVLVILSVVTLGLGGLLFPVLWIVALVFFILAGLAANKGEAYRYPFALRLIK